MVTTLVLSKLVQFGGMAVAATIVKLSGVHPVALPKVFAGTILTVTVSPPVKSLVKSKKLLVIVVDISFAPLGLLTVILYSSAPLAGFQVIRDKSTATLVFPSVGDNRRVQSGIVDEALVLKDCSVQAKSPSS